MRLSKEEFLEIYDDIKKAEEEQEEMQKAVEVLCADSFPIIKDPYENVFYKLMSKLLNDEYFEEVVLGSCTKAYIGDRGYDVTNPEEYYDLLLDCEGSTKENKNNKEKKS